MLANLIEKIKKHRYKILAAVSFVAAGYFFYYTFSDDKKIKLSTFLDALKSQQINQVVVKGDTVFFKSIDSDWYHAVIGSYPLFQLFSQIRQIFCQSRKTPNVSFACEPQNVSPVVLLSLMVPLAGIYAIYKTIPQQYGKEVYKRQTKANTYQKFSSFYGSEKIKTYLKQIIQFMRSPEQYEKFGLRIRRGVLLHGPPGTGKTMLARILANEAGLEFFSASASEFQQIFVGVGPKRIRDIFQKARKVQKGAIIFIDQIDAIGSRSQHWQTKQQRSTINQLLTQIDGFTQNNKIFVIGATNNIQLVDTALLRPGRFDLKIFVPPPDQQDRNGILKTLIRNKLLPCQANDEDLLMIAKNTPGWCGADLENLLNESGYRSIRKNQSKISVETLKETMLQLREKNRQ